MLKFHSLRIADLRPDAEDAIALALEVPAELRSEYSGHAGQHIVLRTQLGGTEERRTYSLINSPGEWPLRIVARVHPAGRMSRHLAEDLKVGDQIEVLPPNGSLTPRVLAGDRPVTSGGIRLFVGFAAGCGITPLLCIARTLLADPAHRFILFYGNTNTSRTMCLEELLALKDKNVGRLALHFVMSREPQEVDLYNGRVDAARVRELAGTLFKPDEVAEYFVCGPGDMIDQVSAALRGLNVDADRIHSEHFTVAASAPGETAGIAVTAKAAATNGHATVVAEPATEAEVPADAAEVTVLMDGRRRSFTMRRNADTVLDAAARAGLDLPFSCRAGVCSTCRTKVVRGEVEMAQNYALEDWELEQGYVLACQATCKTPVLELDYDEK